jgi:hypothetical protein
MIDDDDLYNVKVLCYSITLQNNNLLFFCLETKEAKIQACAAITENLRQDFPSRPKPLAASRSTRGSLSISRH